MVSMYCNLPTYTSKCVKWEQIADNLGSGINRIWNLVLFTINIFPASHLIETCWMWFCSPTSTLPSGNPNLFWTTAVSSRMRRPFSPRTFWVLHTDTHTSDNHYMSFCYSIVVVVLMLEIGTSWTSSTAWVPLTDVKLLLDQRRRTGSTKRVWAASPGGQNDDLGPGGSHSHLHSRVSILCQLAGQKLIQLRFEDAVWNELNTGDQLTAGSPINQWWPWSDTLAHY